jgi:hypothetical protein
MWFGTFYASTADIYKIYMVVSRAIPNNSLSTVSRVNISQLAGGQNLEESKGVKVKLNLHTRKKFFSLVS